MKNLIILITLIFSLNASAGIGWFLLGAAMSESDKKTPPPVKTEFEIQIEKIKEQLPAGCSKDQSVYFSCWNSYNAPVLNINVSTTQAEPIKSYFINSGYAVKLEGNTLSFDFQDQHLKYLEHQKVWISSEGMLGLAFLLFIIGIYLKVNYSYRQKVKKIKELYENNPNDIFFYDKNDKKELEDGLKKLTIPLGWNVNHKDEKIFNITRTTNSGFGIVASSKERMYNRLQVLKPRNLGPKKI